MLDYAELLASYNDDLDSALRGFKPPADFLDTWVPDHDILRSLVNLLEAAQLSGQDQVSIYLRTDHAEDLDVQKFHQISSTLGDVRIEDHTGDLLISVSSMHSEATFETLHPAYRRGVRTASQSTKHARAIKEVAGLTCVQVAADDITLEALVDPNNHIIQDAVYHGHPSPEQRGILETLCGWLIGVPILNAAHHAGIYVEYLLRDSCQQPPAQGIITPETVGEPFLLPVTLTRALLDRYREQSGYSDTDNIFETDGSEEWKALCEKDKIEKLQKTFTNVDCKLPVPASEIRILDIDSHTRVTIALPQTLNDTAKRDSILLLENEVKEKLDHQLCLYLQELKDYNKIRRL